VPVGLAVVPGYRGSALLASAGLMFVHLALTGSLSTAFADLAKDMEVWLWIPEMLWLLWGAALATATRLYQVRRSLAPSASGPPPTGSSGRVHTRLTVIMRARTTPSRCEPLGRWRPVWPSAAGDRERWHRRRGDHGGPARSQGHPPADELRRMVAGRAISDEILSELMQYFQVSLASLVGPPGRREGHRLRPTTAPGRSARTSTGRLAR
jgi:hypothetical protein